MGSALCTGDREACALYQDYRSPSWRVDETYVKVGGKWKYLFRAIDKHGQLIDFMPSDRRSIKAAHRFLGKAVKTMRDWPPSSITTDRLASYPKAIRRLKREGRLDGNVSHRTSKYLNNIVEADHGALKRVIRPRLPDNEDGLRHDKGLRNHAHGPPRRLHRARTRSDRRSPLRQQALRHRCLIKPPASTRFAPHPLMQQCQLGGGRNRDGRGQSASPGLCACSPLHSRRLISGGPIPLRLFDQFRQLQFAYFEGEPCSRRARIRATSS
jgi:transposase-like protein